MKEIFSKRLLNARKLAGLSQDELVQRIGGRVKKTAIAKYERGEMMPEPEVVEALATALQQPVSYFYRPFTVGTTHVEFRAKASLGVRREETIRQMITTRIEHYLALEQLMNEKISFVNPLAGTVLEQAADADTAAASLRETWKTGADGLGNVLSLLEEKGIRVIELDTDVEFDGYSAIVNNDFAVIALRNNDTTTERKRFTALHELAHLLLGFGESVTGIEKERLCSRFAGAMLLPSGVLRRELGIYRSALSTYELGLLKDKYGISALAIAMRAYQSGIIASHTHINLLNLARKDPAEKHIGSNMRTDNATRFDLMLSRALSEHLISISKAAELAMLPQHELMTKYYLNEDFVNS